VGDAKNKCDVMAKTIIQDTCNRDGPVNTKTAQTKTTLHERNFNRKFRQSMTRS